MMLMHIKDREIKR